MIFNCVALPRVTQLVIRSLVIFLVSSNHLMAELVDQLNSEEIKFFESEVRPLLAQKCFECHSGDKSEGGLRLDSGVSVQEGGDSGPAVIPGDLEGSLLIAAVRYQELEMPPEAPLSSSERKVLETWVRRGAFWPEHDASENSGGNDLQERVAQWWAAKPLDPDLPSTDLPASHARHLIDRYVDAKLIEVGLHRAPVTDRARLIRRLSYDLLGLPPSPEAIERFEKDDRPDAYQRLVSEMYSNPAYGERMARLWLDLVRFADSDGWRADAYRPQAWHYRQFVVDAFNESMPYDQFVKMQVAGDEYDPSDERALAAVGFLRLGIYEYNQRDAEGQWQNIVDEITDVTADVFLATGLACAKCHDHKFDPIPRSDYFRMRSVFEPLIFHDWKRPPARSTEQQAEVDRLLAELSEVEGSDIHDLGMTVVGKFTVELQGMYHKSPDDRTSYENQMAYLLKRQFFEEGISGSRSKGKLGDERFAKREQILKDLDKYKANPYADAELMSIRDASGEVRPTRLPGRVGGREFSPGVPVLFGGEAFDCQPPAQTSAQSSAASSESHQSSGRRRALAEWLVSPDNPISARVIVNRLWQYHFGTGLVDSPNDFGDLGNPPSHPHLLDYLATRLIESNWDLQSVQREILLSETYQQSTDNSLTNQAMKIDPTNRFLWHRSVRRVDAEQYRDSLLIAMNQLDYQFGGPSLSGTGPRRSLYLRRMRNSVDEMLTALDTPPGLVGTAKRDVTTTAPQSLMMMNSARVISVANKFAANIRDEVKHGNTENFSVSFVDRAHRVLAGTPPSKATLELLVPLVESGDAGQVDACHVLINSNAFLFVD